jgi:beta-RFAP synthase
VARALAIAAGRSELDALQLACRVGRGERSALGVHGFAQGGFLVEAGKCGTETVAPLVARMDFPEPWRLVLAVPQGPAGLHGMAERKAFEHLENRGLIASQAETLCRLVLLEMLPALAQRDLTAFGECLHEYNARAGEAFAAIQRGTYASPTVAEVVDFLRREGIRGAGQSSWGPAVFAVTADEDHAGSLITRLCARLPLQPSDVFVTRACNHGAVAEEKREG